MSGMGYCYRGLFPDEVIQLVAKIIKGFQNEYLCLRRVDFEDLMQESILHLWAVTGGDLSKYKYVKGFVRRTMKNLLLDIVKREEADKRRVMNEALSLDEEVFIQDEKVSLHEVISSGNILYPGSVKIAVDQAITRIDIDRLTVLLDQKKQQICMLILQGYSIAEISKILSIPRSSIYNQLKIIRNHFLIFRHF
ncbi:MAG: sigma-70 family RNA polymerase sigma factor [Bacteroidales bacterium]|nr:sigma-70 family RNA polymerase sigma factor [Bacteroidales bacterium]